MTEDSRPPPGRRRVILHVDADAFFCQVERRRDPRLAGCPALAVQQHRDVIAADAAAKKAGVTKRMTPADARTLLRRVGGTLVHVHTVAGQRVSYRPYLAASSELHGTLASTELASILAGSDRADGVVVEKASIDEAYVQLPTGSDLATDGARCAEIVRDVVKERCGLVVSVGVAHNKLLAKLANNAAKPDGVRVVTSHADVADLLRDTPAHKLPGCGGALASKIHATLGPDARIADLARLPESRLRGEIGMNPSAARDIVRRSCGECDDPVVTRRNLNKSVGVHTSLALTPRPMYGTGGTVSASGGRPGVFEPLRCRESTRLDRLLRAMAADLAGRVIDLAHAEKRWPRTMTVSLILVLGRGRDGNEEVRCSKRGPFPERAKGGGQSDGEMETGKVAHAAAEGLTRGLIASRGDALVAKVSIIAGEFRAAAGSRQASLPSGEDAAAMTGQPPVEEELLVPPVEEEDATDRDDAGVVDGDDDGTDEWYPSPPFYFNPTAETSSAGDRDACEPFTGAGDGGIASDVAGTDDPVHRIELDAERASPLSPLPSVPQDLLDGGAPIDATLFLRCLAEGTLSGEDAQLALRRRYERTGRAFQSSSAVE